MNQVTIIGKENCPYCDKAKRFVAEKGMKHTYMQIGKDIDLEAALQYAPNAKTVPIVLANGMYIGGYQQLVEFFEEVSGGYGDDI